MKKKFIPLVALLFIALTSFCQSQYSLNAGIGNSFRTADRAFHAHVQTTFTPRWSARFDFENYLFPDDAVFMTLALNFSYNIIHENLYNFYGYGGMLVTHFQSVDSPGMSSESATPIGINAGLGFEYYFFQNLKLFVEVKGTSSRRLENYIFTFPRANQVVGLIGFGYNF